MGSSMCTQARIGHRFNKDFFNRLDNFCSPYATICIMIMMESIRKDILPCLIDTLPGILPA